MTWWLELVFWLDVSILMQRAVQLRSTRLRVLPDLQFSKDFASTLHIAKMLFAQVVRIVMSAQLADQGTISTEQNVTQMFILTTVLLTDTLQTAFSAECSITWFLGLVSESLALTKIVLNVHQPTKLVPLVRRHTMLTRPRRIAGLFLVL